MAKVHSMRSKKGRLIILLVLLVAVISGSFAGAFFALTQDLPQIRSLENFKPDAVTRIYSADKILLAELFLEKREPVPLETIPLMSAFSRSVADVTPGISSTAASSER